jgi:hypothetical protein
MGLISPFCAADRWAWAGRGSVKRTAREGTQAHIIPLSVDEVARFWSSVRTARDLAIVGLMLMHGSVPSKSWP